MVTRRDLLTRGVLLGAAGLSLAGCAPAPTATRREPSGSPTRATRPQPSGSPNATSSASRTLVAVFSRAGENHYYGGRTWLEVGNTEVVVGLLASLVDVDVYRIVPAEPYPTDYEETVALNTREQDANARPRIADPLPDLAGYDRVVLASGVWSVRPPMIMRTFTEALDFTGRTVYPLTTHAGSGLGRAVEVYRQTRRGAIIGEGLAVRGEEAASAGPEVRAWLQRIGLLG